MYAKKNKPMYGKGGSIMYENGGPVKSDSTKVDPIDLFGIDAVLAAKEERDASMEGLSEIDKLRRALGIPEGGSDLDLFGIDAVLDAREAKGLSRNPLDDFDPAIEKAKELIERLQVALGVIDEPEAPKYRKESVKKYRDGGKFPDLTGDGKVTMADILKGRNVFKYGGKMYGEGGMNGDTEKSLRSQLSIAMDPRTSYASEQAREKDISMLQAKLKSLR